MGSHEAMRDGYIALFGCVVFLQAWIGTWGFLRLRRLRRGLPAEGAVGTKLGYAALPDQQMRVALGSAADMWQRTVVWSDTCAGIGGAASAILALPVAITLPISSWYSTAVDRGVVLTGLAFAFSGAGSAIGRCIAISWITPPATTVSGPSLSPGRRQVTMQAMALWAVDLTAALLIAVALVTSVRTPSAEDYVVPRYVVLVLLFPTLLGIDLAAEMWLGRKWRALLRSILSIALNLSSVTEQGFRTFAGTLMNGRTRFVGISAGIGQFLFTAWIASYQPYFDSLADVAGICGIIAVVACLLTWAMPITSFTLPPDEETSAVPSGLPVGES